MNFNHLKFLVGKTNFENSFSKKGFTLVEMLMVVIIIGILASAIIPRLISVLSNARDTTRLADINTLSQALEMYYNNEGEYPNSGELGACIDKDNNSLKVLQKNFLITSFPSDPQKMHRNFGTRNQNISDNSTAGCIGEYDYVGMNGNFSDARVPDMNLQSLVNGANKYGLGYNGYVLTFSPENFSKGNYINPTDTAWKNVGRYGYAFDWYRNSDFYKQFLCNGKVEYVPASQQVIQNTIGASAILQSLGDNCKTNDPQRVIYAKFNQ